MEIAAELVHELDPDGKQLRVVKLTDYTAEKVPTLCTGLEDLRARWPDATERAAIIEQLRQTRPRCQRREAFGAVASEARHRFWPPSFHACGSTWRAQVAAGLKSRPASLRDERSGVSPARRSTSEGGAFNTNCGVAWNQLARAYAQSTA